MLDDRADADDAVQETWLRLSRTDIRGVENLRGWLTKVVARVCLDMLRSRKSRRWEPLDERAPAEPARKGTPEDDVLMADSIGAALLVVLQRLPPAERVAFVLHDLFDLPFEDIAPIVGRTPPAARQLASRARRRVRGVTPIGGADRIRQREIVDAFLAASRSGDLEGLLALLAPDVVLRADPAAQRMGAPSEVRGARVTAAFFKGRALGAEPAVVADGIGLIVAPGGRLRIVVRLTIAEGKIARIDAIAEAKHLDRIKLAVLDD